MERVACGSYSNIEERLDKLINESGSEIESWRSIDFESLEVIDSNLDVWDYCFAITIGSISPFISTSEELQDYLKEIHNASSEASGDYDFLQKLLGRLLHHKGDPMDKMGPNFIKRDKEKAYILFHRLLWGHDIFSKKEDNPFFLMVRKQGLSGIVQAMQHLLADTTSKQGLPFPGSSYLDYFDEDGYLSNYLIDICQQLSIDVTGSKRAAQEIYSHMFTVRAADMMGAGSTEVLNTLYFKIRRMSDEVRKQQFSLISYSISFWIQAIIGTSKLGVPDINIPVGTAMIKSFASLYSANTRRTKSIVNKGRRLEKETERLIAVAEGDFDSSEVCFEKEAHLKKLESGQNNVRYLLQAWAEDMDE